MLAVGIHDESVGKSGRSGGLHGREDGGAFAAVGWQMENVQAALFLSEELNFCHAFIGASIEDNPNWTPDGEDGSSGFHQEAPTVETGQNDEMGRIGKRSGRGQRTDLMQFTERAFSIGWPGRYFEDGRGNTLPFAR